MPLLTSPIDGSPMRQIRRYGIEIDVCPSSGGIWLDKGELEKIMHLLQEDAAAEQSNVKPLRHQMHRDDDNDDEDDDDYSDYRRFEKKGHYGSGKHYKKEGKMSRIMDLFDF
jgi:Zn-finger nucleic acid-binding protein